MTLLHVDLLSKEGFDAAFCRAISEHETYEKAYESVEKVYEKDFGMRKYASYDSYRRTRTRRIKLKLGLKSKKVSLSAPFLTSNRNN